MSFLNGTTTVQHITALPTGATRKQGVSMLRNHELFLHCNPHLVKFTLLDEPATKPTSESPPLPERIKSVAPARRYEVQDLVHNLPGGLWDSNVTSTYEITDIEDGIFVRIRSPMSIVMDTFWEIQEPAAATGGKGDDDGKVPAGLAMVESITISASRLILPVVKSLCEGGWDKIHAKMLESLQPLPAATAADGSIPVK